MKFGSCSLPSVSIANVMEISTADCTEMLTLNGKQHLGTFLICQDKTLFCFQKLQSESTVKKKYEKHNLK